MSLLVLVLAGCNKTNKEKEITTIQLNVPGSLADSVPEKGWNSVKNLRIVGSINNEDLLFIKALDANGLEELDLSQTTGLTEIGTEFCFNKFSALVLPNSVETILNGAFQGCSNLKSVSVLPDNQHFTVIDSILYSKDQKELVVCPAQCGKQVVNISSNIETIYQSALSECSDLKAINVDVANVNYESVDGVLYNKGKEELISYPSGKLDSVFTLPASVTVINWSAFWEASHLQNIQVDSSNLFFVSADGVLLHKNSPNLGQYAIDNPAVVLVTFPSGKKSKSYTIPNNVTNVTAFAFKGNKYVKKISIPSSIEEIEKTAFQQCAIEEIKMAEPNSFFNTEDGLLYSNNIFFLSPAGRKNNIKIEDGCLGLTELSIQRNDFIKSITIPSNTIIRSFACSYCTSLENVKINEGISQLGGVGDFVCCTKLKTISLPSTLESLNEMTFFGCLSMEEIDCHATVPPATTMTTFTGINKKKCVIKVPKESISEYKNSEWGQFANIVAL